MAEQGRFELPLGYSPTDGFQDRSLQPLEYCSKDGIIIIDVGLLLKKNHLFSEMIYFAYMVGATGLEPVTFCTSNRCSPS